MKDKLNKWNDLELFERHGARIGAQTININKKKYITFSSGFIHHAKLQMMGKTHVLLFYSKATNAIVFDFIDNPEKTGAIKLTLIGKSQVNYVIAGKSFFNYYDFDITKIIGKYPAKFENIPNFGERWVIYLNEKIYLKQRRS